MTPREEREIGWTPIEPGAVRLGRMARVVKTGARLMQESLCASGERFRVAFLTLTYRDAVEWEANQIRAFMKRLREFLSRRGLSLRCVWVLEATKRGRPHYHLAIWLPRGVTLPKPDKRGWWPHGMTNCQWAKRPIGYIAKYASKAAESIQVKGARLYAVSGLRSLERLKLRWWRLPRWLRELVRIEDDTRRIARCGWVSLLTGEQYRSPFVVRSLGWCFAWKLRDDIGGGGRGVAASVVASS